MAPPAVTCITCGKTHAKCVGHRKSDGQPCSGQVMTGQSVCRMHGGSASQNRKAGERRTNEQKTKERIRVALHNLGVRDDVDPHEALLTQVRRTEALERWLGDEVAFLQEQGESLAEGPGQALWRAFRDEARLHILACKTAIDCGVAERHVLLAEQQGALVASIMRKVFGDPELGLTAEQQEAMRRVAARHLRAVS